MTENDEKIENNYRALANARCAYFLHQTADLRVSEKAILSLNTIISHIGHEIATKAKEIAVSDNRITIKKRDIYNAALLLEYPFPTRARTIDDDDDEEEDVFFDDEEEEEE